MLSAKHLDTEPYAYALEDSKEMYELVDVARQNVKAILIVQRIVGATTMDSASIHVSKEVFVVEMLNVVQETTKQNAPAPQVSSEIR